jgi:hypothetical protein
MPPHLLPPGSPGTAGNLSGPSGPRFAWTDVAVLLIVIGFAVFLIYRGMSVQAAAITSVSTVSGTIIVVLVPRKLADWVRALQQINVTLGHLPGGRALPPAQHDQGWQ